MRKKQLQYYWKAIFSDGSSLEQFENEKEVLFKEVEKRMEDLYRFYVISEDEKEVYYVDLKNKKLFSPKKTFTITGSNPELIYKRRNVVRIDRASGKVIDPTVIHILGLKTSTQEKQFEICGGNVNRPKKAELVDLKRKTKKDLLK